MSRAAKRSPKIMVAVGNEKLLQNISQYADNSDFKYIIRD
jgi:hypothetical protein